MSEEEDANDILVIEVGTPERHSASSRDFGCHLPSKYESTGIDM